MNILEIQDKPLSEIINPKNESVKNSTRYSASHPTLWNLIRHKINGYQASKNIDKTFFKFSLEKPPDDHYNHERLNNYIKFYLEDYIKRNHSLSVEKVIKPEYASPEISSKENKEDIFYIVQILW
ncbi:45087_t:CDS:2 [Gigaspora margarita]|uniref:45087_t:CDS:1 n=1 Tax=Gigaspora margarita TaxID=4874 RepID=A0ABN7UF99_GIGMA|nr:45087_t:CDS:2 [Gigaspora margarita]